MGYQGETKGTDDSQNKGANDKQVKDHLNGLFSLVQGLGGTSVVRTYIDQLAQVLSALVGWSKIEQCEKGKNECKNGNDNDKGHGNNGTCQYLVDVKPNEPCKECGCMKWNVTTADKEHNGHHLGRGCTRCSDSSGPCGCSTSGSSCTAETCKCAEKGKCCKCCCKEKCAAGCAGENAKCICDRNSYRSAYPRKVGEHWVDGSYFITWKQLKDTTFDNTGDGTPSTKRSQCARILLGSVCLIWSGVTYMHWTGKWTKGSPYWNNHILDGSGLDDGTLSQWLQALGFPKAMLNSKGPKNRLDQVIWDGFMGKLFLGFTHPSGSGAKDGNTAKQPFWMNYAGFVHTAHRDSFNNEAKVFPNGTDTNQHKIGAIFKLYILSCAYFTGLQKKTTHNTPRTPKTIREILYWLSALPYSHSYKQILDYAKGRLSDVLKKPEATDSSSDTPKLSFLQQGRDYPITVDEYNLFAHFQAVTQYCPLVLIGIQGGLHSAKGTDKTKEPPIHSLYSNSHFSFTYPSVDIQAYNQVVHYIRALFYQLYFLRKQCAVKVTCGGKWRECRYGSGVLGKGVISWMCLGCNPMEHDRKCRVDGVKKEGREAFKALVKQVKEWKGKEQVIQKLRDILVSIGDVVVQLGNAQEAFENNINNGKVAIEALKRVGVENGSNLKEVLEAVLAEVEKKVKELETVVDGLNGLTDAAKKATDALSGAKEKVGSDNDKKNQLNAAHHGIQKVLEILKKCWNSRTTIGCQRHIKEDIANAFENMEDIVGRTRCVHCHDHSTKCGRQGEKKTCPTCHQQYMDGFPSPLQAFLEDRLPGFSCQEVLYTEDTDKYPPAASHLGHCGGSGQCCPLPMGFRGQFYSGSASDSTGSRLYGILYFFSNENMMQSCVYTLVRVTAELSATTPQVLGDVFGFFRGGVGNKESGKNKHDREENCKHEGIPGDSKHKDNYFCGWCASGLRDVVKKIEWIPKKDPNAPYRDKVVQALIKIKGDKGTGNSVAYSSNGASPSPLSALTKDSEYLSPLTGELYTAVSATFGGTYLSWVLYLSDALEGGLQSLSDAFKEIECRGCRECDPNKCKKGSHGKDSGLCGCQSIVSCTGVLPVLYRHGFSYGNPFNLEGYQQKGKDQGDYSIEKKDKTVKHCHEFLDSLNKVIDKKKEKQDQHPLSELLKQVGQLQYDIRLPWIFFLTIAWLVAVLYLAFGAIWPLDWTHMRSHWLRGGEHQWQCMWYKVMTGRKGVELMEYFGRR